MPEAAACDLPGWAEDDLAAALAAYRLTANEWGGPVPPLSVSDPAAWFAQSFTVAPETPAFLTGYYEPELDGAAQRGGAFQVPLLGLPPQLTPGADAPDRTAIAAGCFDANALCWVANPLDAFLAQVQGSTRVRLQDGQILRLGYAGQNGHPYRSIGKELVARGAVPPGDISVQAIRDWCAQNPDQVADLLAVNPSYVFFKLLDLPPEAGPIGTMGASVSAMRSIAVDPAHVPLGSPVWVEAPGMAPRLIIAQDTGGAIKGAGRGDLFIGSGAKAGVIAGNLRLNGTMRVLCPVGAA